MHEETQRRLHRVQQNGCETRMVGIPGMRFQFDALGLPDIHHVISLGFNLVERFGTRCKHLLLLPSGRVWAGNACQIVTKNPVLNVMPLQCARVPIKPPQLSPQGGRREPATSDGSPLTLSNQTDISVRAGRIKAAGTSIMLYD